MRMLTVSSFSQSVVITLWLPWYELRWSHPINHDLWWTLTHLIAPLTIAYRSSHTLDRRSTRKIHLPYTLLISTCWLFFLKKILIHSVHILSKVRIHIIIFYTGAMGLYLSSERVSQCVNIASAGDVTCEFATAVSRVRGRRSCPSGTNGYLLTIAMRISVPRYNVLVLSRRACRTGHLASQVWWVPCGAASRTGEDWGTAAVPLDRKWIGYCSNSGHRLLWQSNHTRIKIFTLVSFFRLSLLLFIIHSSPERECLALEVNLWRVRADW